MAEAVAADLPAATIEALFAPGRDLADVKLSVDHLVDDSLNTEAGIAMIDRMTAEVRAILPEKASGAERLATLRRYLYKAEDWNGGLAFSYDQADPLGTNPVNRKLSRYLETRRGNCITMPMLMLFIGKRLGLNMTLAQAPLHLFIKYTDDDGKTWNLEATSGGGFTRDIWYRQKLPMSDEAVANGVYLRSLSHDEAVAVIGSTLVEHALETGNYENAIAISNVLLKHYPNFAYLLAKTGSAYGGLLHRELAGKYTRMEDIPADLKAQADEWYRLNGEAFAKAEALGWRPDDGQIQ
ncbi:transglutaminase family protein (plasmid) [Rhizobium leguminosarum]